MVVVLVWKLIVYAAQKTLLTLLPDFSHYENNKRCNENVVVNLNRNILSDQRLQLNGASNFWFGEMLLSKIQKYHRTSIQGVKDSWEILLTFFHRNCSVCFTRHIWNPLETLLLTQNPACFLGGHCPSGLSTNSDSHSWPTLCIPQPDYIKSITLNTRMQLHSTSLLQFLFLFHCKYRKENWPQKTPSLSISFRETILAKVSQAGERVSQKG